MLPEAIAIVLAPTKDPSMGVFKLTDPLGLQVIGECRNPNMFHPHDRYDELYHEVSPFEVVFAASSLQVADLR